MRTTSTRSRRWSAAESRLGAVFASKWRLERLLGLGGMGAVYEARHRNGSRAAVKVLHSDLATSEHERARFRREAYIANRVEHPAVVHVLDDEEHGDDCYLVMELVEGTSLDTLAGPSFGQSELLDVAEQVLDALVVAHARGVIHRDIKPQNLLLDHEHRVRILDFGIARLTDDEAVAPITEAGVILGTIEFMAPEQIRGLDASERSDLYALGATLFTLATGRYLHPGACTMERLARIAREPSPSLASARGAFDRGLVDLVDRATRPSATDRWSSAEQMRREVRRVRASRPPPAWDLGRTERSEQPTRRMRTPPPAPVAPEVLQALSSARHVVAPRTSRSTRMLVAASTGVFLVLLLTLFGFDRCTPSPAASARTQASS